jgi:hypothetical protein
MSRGRTPGRALVLAEDAHHLVQISPLRAEAAAQRALEAARAEPDSEAEAAALHALSWAQFQLGDAASAVATVKAGIRVAEQHGHSGRAGLLRRRLAWMYACAGLARSAERELDTAVVLLDDVERARSEVFRIEIKRRARRVDPLAESKLLSGVSAALDVLRRRGDRIWEARLLYNRAAFWLERGELEDAELDLREARALYAGLGATDAETDATVGLAEIALQRGDLVGCLRLIDEAEGAAPEGHLGVNLTSCRVAALVQARLLPEAREATTGFAEMCRHSGRGDWAAAATLDLASIDLMSGDVESASRLASQAARSFSSRGARVSGALARLISLRAELLSGSVRVSAARSAASAATVLEAAGWRREALRARVLVARLALATGHAKTARAELATSSPLGSIGTVADRVELRYAQALLHLADGDAAGAGRLLATGLQIVEHYQAALGAEELRVSASSIGAELSATGLGLALASGRPSRILSWAEKLRANSLRVPPVTPAADSRLGRLQAELRRVIELSRLAQRQGRPVRGLDRRRLDIEAEIRQRARLAEGAPEGPRGGSGTRSDVIRVLGERALVEFVEHDGDLAAVSITGGRLRVHSLGAADTRESVEWLRFGLGRLARRAPPAEIEAALAGVTATAGDLDRLLLEPIASFAGRSPLVVVPTGPLHALPWGVLPSLHGRPVVVAPSLETWAELARRRRSRARRIALVAGPKLRYSAAEVEDLGRLHPGATVLSGKDATAAATLSALDGAALAHLACHGTFRADSPLFSALELADGPLNVYELQSLKRAPEVVVLSACDLGQAGVFPGDELLGMAAALLGMGTRTIVASVVPVSDAGARSLMLDLHRELVAGADVATALAVSQAGRPEAGFVCLGAS